MAGINDWLNETKANKPELNDFIIQVESYFSKDGFNIQEFEKTVEVKLKSLENEVKESLKTEDDAEDKKNNG